MDAPDQNRGSAYWPAVIVKVVLIGIVLAITAAIVLPLYGDYLPQQIASNARAIAPVIRNLLGEDCTNDSSVITQQTVNLARSNLAGMSSQYIAERKLFKTSDGNMKLEVTINEVRWGLPRLWSVAIPAGSTVIWTGRCAGEKQFEWRLSEASTAPQRFLRR